MQLIYTKNVEFRFEIHNVIIETKQLYSNIIHLFMWYVNKIEAGIDIYITISYFKLR